MADIETAFAEVRLGSGVSLHKARALDDYLSDAEVNAARSNDLEGHWQAIPDEKIERFSDTLAFMDAEGFRFYLPRFMLYSLTHLTTSDSFAVLAPIYICTVDNDYLRSMYTLLTVDQRRVVARFLRLMADQRDGYPDAARQALDYWGQFTMAE